MECQLLLGEGGFLGTAGTAKGRFAPKLHRLPKNPPVRGGSCSQCYFRVIFHKTSGAERGFMNLSLKDSGARRTDGHVAEITEDTVVVTVNTGGGAGH